MLVAVDGGGASVRQEGNGLLVPLRDPAALADAIELLLGDAALRTRFGEASRRMAVEEFSEERIVAQYLDLYRRIGVLKDDSA